MNDSIFISTIMMLRYEGYNVFSRKEIPSVSNKLNVQKDRHVYIVDDYCYKVFENEQDCLVIIENIKRGFYKRSSPHLVGLVYDYQTLCGYVTYKCELHINPTDIVNIRQILMELYLETNLCIYDFHSGNFGKFGKSVCLLDLEAIRPYNVGMNSKDLKYNQFVKQWAC